jgi:hypothetical protein
MSLLGLEEQLVEQAHLEPFLPLERQDKLVVILQ